MNRVFIGILFLIFVVGIGVMLYFMSLQHTTIELLSDELTWLEVDISELEQEIDGRRYIKQSLCTEDPVETPVGTLVYPIDERYGNLTCLGQLFTAYTCGPDRTALISGVHGDEYTLGSTIWLETAPDKDFVNTLKEIGYGCVDELMIEWCTKWQLTDTVKIENLMKIERFYRDIKRDDCAHNQNPPD